MSSAARRPASTHRLIPRGLWATAGAAVALIVGWAPPAPAGTYTAWSCRNGANQGTSYVADWARSSVGIGSAFIGHSTECQTIVPEAGAVGMRTEVHQVADNDPNLAYEDLSITTRRADLSMRTARLWWRGAVGDNGQIAAIALAPDGSQRTLLDRRASFPASGDPNRGEGPTDTLDLGDATGLTLRAACLGGCTTPQPTPTTPFAAYEAYRVAFTVSDAAAPLGSATGDLLTSDALAGTRSATVDAADRGGGLYQARIVVDGQVQAATGFGDIRCRDLDPSNEDPFEFLTIRPCPLHETASVALDTTTLSEDAYHDVRVQVVDAAGNATDLARRTVGVDNRPPSPGFFDRATRRFENPEFNIGLPRRLNGTDAAAGAILRVYLPVRRSERIRHGAHRGERRQVTRGKRKRTVRFTSRPSLLGVLTDAARRPMAGAKVWMATRIEGSDWQITGRPHTTSSNGRVGLRLPAEAPSRQINLVYFPFTDSHEQSVGQPVRLNVRASVRLTVGPHRLRNGQRVRFHGVVEGLRPGRGITTSLQVKQGRRYRTFRQIRLRPASRGRFRVAYRFTATRRTTRYRFRLLVLKQAGLPYERAASKVGTVVVTP